MEDFDWSKVSDDTSHVRVNSKNTYCCYKDITEDGSYQYMYSYQDKWTPSRDFPCGWFSGELIARPMVTNDVPLVTSLLNTKIDLRKEDGTIDIELSKAFQEACFEQGVKWCGLYAEISDLAMPFLFAEDDMCLGYASEDDIYFFQKHPAKQINFKYTRKLEWEATEVAKSHPKVDLVDGGAYMFDFKESKGLIGILHSEIKYGSLHRMFHTGGGVSQYNSSCATNIKRLVPEESK